MHSLLYLSTLAGVPVQAYLLLAVGVFVLGLFMLLTRRNAIMALLGVELMLNAANINLIAFNALNPTQVTGNTFALFVIVVAAAEAAVALALVVQVYRKLRSVDLTDASNLGG